MLEVISLPIDRVRVAAGDVANYRALQPDVIRGLAADIAARGQQDAVTVRRDGDGYVLVDGHHRHAAMLAADLPSILARLLPDATTDADARRWQLAANLHRAHHSPMEEAVAIGRLRDLDGLDSDAIAAVIGRTRGYVDRRLALLRLDESVRAVVGRAGGLSVEAAEAVADLPPESQLLAVQRIGALYSAESSPTLSTVLRVVGELQRLAEQQTLFGAEFDGPVTYTTLCEVTTDLEHDPPLPGGSLPDWRGSLRDVLAEEAEYWRRAAVEWRVRGREPQARQCDAAESVALRTIGRLPADDAGAAESAELDERAAELAAREAALAESERQAAALAEQQAAELDEQAAELTAMTKRHIAQFQATMEQITHAAAAAAHALARMSVPAKVVDRLTVADVLASGLELDVTAQPDYWRIYGELAEARVGRDRAPAVAIMRAAAQEYQRQQQQ